VRRRAAAVLLAIAAIAVAISVPAASGAGSQAQFWIGADTESFTPPARGAIQNDPADCATPADAAFNGPRQFAYEEPYIDQQGDGHYDFGDPFLDCNGDGRWDGNFIGGGGGNPRYYDHVADQVGARALVVSNQRRTIAIEVVDQEGLFNTYADRIRAQVARDGYHFDSIQISATHDESAPDSLGLGGAESVTSGTNNYWVNFLVRQSALAIENAYGHRQQATITYAQATEPANLRQCWSSYPFIDDQLMPVMQAKAVADGHVIATLASVGQHTESLGFNSGSQVDPGDPSSPQATLDQEKQWLSADWPYWFRSQLEQDYPGSVGIEMAGSVGSVETPEVWSNPLSRTPQQFIDESHPAGCRTLFASSGTMTPLGYFSETKTLGQDLAGAVEQALSSPDAAVSQTNRIWAQSQSVCLPVDNVLFKAASLGGVFAQRPAYGPGCLKAERVPALPTGQTAGTSIKTEVAAWRIGDAEFIGLPGEVFPFTYFRGPVGPEDMNYPQYGLPPWPLPYMHTPFRFFDGLDNDMVGYIFPRGNDAGVPGDHPVKNPTATGTDRFGCGHSDDSEAVSDKAGDKLGTALVDILRQHGAPESIEQGRYVLPDGKLSRNPEGTTDTIKCTAPTDTTFAADGPAVAVWEPGVGRITPAQWMDLAGRPQSTPDRNTRGFIDAAGRRHWLDVFADIANQPGTA